MENGNFKNREFEKILRPEYGLCKGTGWSEPFCGAGGICGNCGNLRKWKVDPFAYAWRLRPSYLRNRAGGRKKGYSTWKMGSLRFSEEEKIGFVFQAYNLVPVLNVYENIVLPIQLDGGVVDTDFVEQIIDILGLSEKINSLPNQLSGGQQQRVAIARALATKPSIILADEPTGNLDSKTSQDVLGLLKVTGQKFKQTIVMITHNEEIAQMADRIIRIEDGRIISGGGRYQCVRLIITAVSPNISKKVCWQIKREMESCWLPLY